MLITLSEITFLTLYSLVTGTHYKNNLMKCHLLESLLSWGCRGGRQEYRRKAEIESIMLRFTDNRSTSEIAYYYSYLRCDCNNRSRKHFIHCGTDWQPFGGIQSILCYLLKIQKNEVHSVFPLKASNWARPRGVHSPGRRRRSVRWYRDSSTFFMKTDLNTFY